MERVKLTSKFGAHAMSGEEKAEPLDSERAASIRARLHDIIASDAFKGGKRAQDFLQLIVEHALAGRFEHLRERMIGVEMFGRPVDYDTANDAVVRVKATEVRKRLAQYYLILSAPPSVRIDLPAGSYVPQFSFEAVPRADAAHPAGAPSVLDAATEQAESSPFPRKKWIDLTPRTFALVTVLLALLAVLAASVVWRGWPWAQSIRTIAILPLVNFSGDPSQDYFADGMTDELTAELGQISTLRVISRTSTMTFKGTRKTLPEIAKELKVDDVVEGSVEREGNHVRVVTQLIDSRTDQHIWAHTYDSDMTSVLQLQSDVARAIADQIRIKLTPAQEAHFNRVQQVDPEAVELYLQGIYHENTADPKGALEYLRKSVAKDPHYTAAHSALANVYGWMGEAGWIPYAEAFSQQREEAIKAIDLDDSRPEPHLELGRAAMDLNWDWTTQKREIQRALDMNPNSANVADAYANYLSRIGRAKDAIAQSQLKIQLDPVSSRSFLNAAFISYFARQYDLALEQIQQASALEHKEDEGYFPLGVIYVEKGMYGEGIEEFRKIGDLPHALGHLGNAYARQGNKDAALAAINQLKGHIAKTGIGRYEVALVYAGLHDNDNAFAWLEQAFQVRDKGLTYIKIDPCLDPLRSDPRFQNLLKRVGIPA